jgi:hypothetical protein
MATRYSIHDGWILDCCASAHMIDQAEMITNKVLCSTCIAVGGGTLRATHKGDAKLTVMRNGKKGYLKLRNGLVVPDLGMSLMSWRNFDDAGAKLDSKYGKCWKGWGTSFRGK